MNDSNTAESVLSAIWSDDKLARSKMAGFLTTLVEKKESLSQNGFTLSIDAPWGSGKTFFIQRWIKELESKNRVAIYFDAWKNDFSGNPVETFLGTLHAEVIKIEDKKGVEVRIKRSLATAKRNTSTALRKALYPTLKFAAKQGFKKIVGAGFDDFQEYIQKDSADQAHDQNSDEIDQSINLSEESLNKYFEQAVDSAGERQNALNQFRNQLEQLVQKMREAENSSGPLYIFVDELDRCRPTYALELLEGIKHIFAVKGVVYILSTNLEQLANSTRAVYGPTFDGHMYLKRFNDMQFTLPVPDLHSYIDILIGNSLQRITPILGYQESHNRQFGANGPIKILAEAFELDPRSLNVIVAKVDAVIANFKDGEKVALLWLYFLAVVNYKSPQVFQSIGGRRVDLDSQEFLGMLSELTKKKIKINTHFENVVRSGVASTAPLNEFLKCHLSIAHTPVSHLRSLFRSITSINTVDNIVMQCLTEGWHLPTGNEYHPIYRYFDLVETAGYIS